MDECKQIGFNLIIYSWFCDLLCTIIVSWQIIIKSILFGVLCNSLILIENRKQIEYCFFYM